VTAQQQARTTATALLRTLFIGLVCGAATMARARAPVKPKSRMVAHIRSDSHHST
jgi:hypothetical protein